MIGIPGSVLAGFASAFGGVALKKEEDWVCVKRWVGPSSEAKVCTK